MGGPWELYQQQADPHTTAGGQVQTPEGMQAGPMRSAPGEETGFVELSPNAQKAHRMMEFGGFTGNRALEAAGKNTLEADPTYEARKAQAVDIGKMEASLRERRDAIKHGILPRIEDFERLGREAGPDILRKATGPDYGSNEHGGSWLPQFMPDASSQAYQAKRAMLQKINPFNYTSLGDGEGGKSYDRALSLNLKLHHLNDAVAQMVKSLPSAGKGTSTDTDTALVKDMIGQALHAPDEETFFKILHDAKNAIRGRAKMGDLPEQHSYAPPEWKQPQLAQRPVQSQAAAPQPDTGGAGRFAQPAMAQAEQPQRVTATNPQTGVTLEWNGQAWVRAR